MFRYVQPYIGNLVPAIEEVPVPSNRPFKWYDLVVVSTLVTIAMNPFTSYLLSTGCVAALVKYMWKFYQ